MYEKISGGKKMIDVIIIGAGPAGLTLAYELALQNINCVIIEKRSAESNISRAFSLASYTLELLEMRGIAQSMVEKGLPCYFAPLSDGIRYLDLSNTPSRFNYLLTIPQVSTNQILERFCLDKGVMIIREAELLNLNELNNYIEVEYIKEGRYVTLKAIYVIGCDGIHSRVRNLAKINFKGVTVEKSLMHADVTLGQPPKNLIFAKTTQHGMVATIPFKDNLFRVLVIDNNRMHIPVERKLTLEEFKSSMNNIIGSDFGISSAHWLQRFRGQQRHASSYRSNRIILCGDAAHSHLPAGGQGLQMCIQDAFNLGWKLAAVISGKASDRILDTYTSERRPIIESAMKHSLRMFHYETSFNRYSVFIMRILNSLLKIPLLSNWAISKISGSRIRYKLRETRFYNVVGKKFTNRSVLSVDNIEMSLSDALNQGKPVFLTDPNQLPLFLKNISLSQNFLIAINKNPIGYFKQGNILIRPDGIIAYQVKKWVPEKIQNAVQLCFDRI
jgi:2-polyprenyl-6-methoxyphenol hydroxylase-like FAD-dependent oxidoreductase